LHIAQGKADEAAALRHQPELTKYNECPWCMERPAKTALTCGHCYCCDEACGSSLAKLCPTCDMPVTSRTRLFGASCPSQHSLSPPEQGAGLFSPEQDAGLGCSLQVGMKVIGFFAGRRGCAGWYQAKIAAVPAKHPYVLAWDDVDKKDTH